MRRWLIIKVLECIVLVSVCMGAAIGLSCLLPPGGFQVAGGIKLSRNTVLNFQCQVGKSIIVQRSVRSRMGAKQLNDL